MRKFLALIAVAAFLFAACAEDEPTIGETGAGSTGETAATGPTGPTAELTAADCAAGTDVPYVNAGVLTVATDSPVYPPWFLKNDPSNGKGYESALTYAVAEQMGFGADQVEWVVEPFNKSYAPGPKSFDFDINEISITPERAEVVTFSDGYYDVTQALVTVKGSSLDGITTAAELDGSKLGAQIGTTSLAYISQYIPGAEAGVYDTTNDAIAALQVGQVDGLILDLPTASYVSAAQVEDGVLVGQFPPVGEQYGMLFEKDNPLVECVNLALATLMEDGTVQALQDEYLADYQAVPVIAP
jgi:polar amino acid transport system substrate-binding protein